MKKKALLERKIHNSIKILTLLLLIFSALAEIQAQNQKVTIFSKQITIKSAFEEIEKQTNMKIAYNAKRINLDKTISVDIKNKSLAETLSTILNGTGNSYVIEGKQIIIVPAKTNEIKNYTGLITDESDNPIIGAVVRIVDSQIGVIADIDGKFSIEASSGSILSISYLGYKTEEIKLGTNTNLRIVLHEDSQFLDEVIVVGYGVQRKGNLTGAVSSINTDKITVAPISNITNTLGGLLPGLGSKQSRGTPGSDDASLWIRGFGDVLVIVDGAESSMNHLDPSQVESISILKDASASIYGARAGNGVILVTTKRGIESKPTINVHSSITLQGSTNIFPATSSWQRAQLKREQHFNAELPISLVPYTEEEIQKFKDGTDPNYGNYNWFDATIRPWAPQQNHNVSVRGGNDKIKYYGYLGYNNQETIFRNNGGDYTRYNLQSSIDANITKRLKASVDITMIKRKEYFPAGDGLNHYNIWETIYGSDPAYPAYLPDPDKLSYANIPTSAIYTTSTKWAGYSDNRNVHLRSSGSVSYDFEHIKGLTAKAMIYYNYYVNSYKKFTKQQDFYMYDFENDRYTLAGSSTSPTSLYQQSQITDDLTQQYSLSYNKIFNEIHNLSALLVYETINYSGNNFDTQRSGFNSTVVEQFSAGDPSTASNASWSTEMGRVSWISRINYAFKNRYLIETIFRADASAKFAKNSRWGYFPSMSLGWVLSEEDFIQSFSELDNLKLRLSVGKAGYDNIGDYQFLSVYGFDGGYKIGDKITTGIYSTRLANTAFSWEEMTNYNIGIDFSFFNRKLYGTVEGFYRFRDGILGTRNASLPSSFGAVLPTENINSENTRGFELSLGSAGKLSDLNYDVSANISWNRSKYDHLDEADFENDDQRRIDGRSGRWTNIQYGYISDGLFTSQEEIDQLSFIYADLNGNSTLRPGDIKYKDLNGDNKLDWRDQTIIGKGSRPNWMFGLNGTFQYKGFDLSLLFQGAFGYSTYIQLDPLTTDFAFNQRWTEENNNPNAIVPRVGSHGLNYLMSDYHMHNTSYVRLKNAALGYSIPKNILHNTGIGNVRIYVAGTNLFTLSSLSKYGVNPEQSGGSPNSFYPMQRTISFGLDLSF